jgi:hypothetical protein
MQNSSLAKWFTGFAVSAALAASAQAALTVSYQFNGNGNWSLDAVGGNSTPVGDLQALVPTGSTVVKAFLYSSTFGSTVNSVNFDGTSISGASWTALGVTAGLQAFRTDVTAQVAAKIGSGSASLFTFSILGEDPNFGIDGQALAIVYSNAAEQERTIAFLDGFSATGGDSTAINLASPLTAAQLGNANFEAQMSLGIGYSFQPAGQYSTVDVNGQRLTSSAGGFDDGEGANGGLITMGGIGDSPANPANPFQTDSGGSRYDDELYNLVPFLAAGQSQIAINTRNPSSDDNIFFAGFNITASAGVNQPPPPPTNRVPDAGSSVGLLGLALAGLAALRRKRA